MRRTVSGLSVFVVAASMAACTPTGEPANNPERIVLSGDSALVTVMEDAAREFDVPPEILAAVGWSETRLIDRAHADHGHHIPGAMGIMGIPEEGTVRSVGHAAELLGVSHDAVETDLATNIRGAAAILRSLAPSGLVATGSRDVWLEVVAKYFDAGAAGDDLALEVRRTIAQGLETVDVDGKSFEIKSYAELYAHRAPAQFKRSNMSAQYPGASWVAAHSSNFSAANRRNADIDVIVVHTVQGSYAGAISWFRNPSANVSAHYVVRRSDGAVTQMLQHKDIGWHAGNSEYNRRSIGIEHEGWVADSNNYTSAMMESSANLSRWLCDTLGIPKDRQHIVAHSEVPRATHTDPGVHFPWNSYLTAIRNGSAPPPPPPPMGTGTIQGVVYEGTDTNSRVGGAQVTIMPGGQTVMARNNDAYWSFQVAPGTYTISASANGYTTGMTTRTVTEGSQTWGSVSVTQASSPTTGRLRGVVYDATKSDLETRVGGARVSISNGDTAVVPNDGSFDFELAAGDYMVTVEASGWETVRVMRSVTAGGTQWGSIGLVPEMMMPTNRPPQTPMLTDPTSGLEVRHAAPIFTVDGLDDPDGDALTLTVEIFGNAQMTDRVSEGRVAVNANTRLASWQHPRDDLPRSRLLYWRVRANDGTADSPWSQIGRFRTTAADGTPTPGNSPFDVAALPGVGTNAPPGATSIIDPADGTLANTQRPQFIAERASDPEGDVLSYQFQVAADDLFEAIQVTSPVVADEGGLGPSWVTDRDLAPGARYYVRVRAADDRVFGPWSVAAVFDVAETAAGSPEERPGFGGDLGGMPMIDVNVDAQDGGCSTTSGSRSSGFAGLMIALAFLFVRSRSRTRL